MSSSPSAPPPTLAARQLAQVLHSQDWIDSLPEDQRPTTLAQAYDLQEALEQALGYRRIGWKVAGSSVRGLRASPSGKANFGLLWAECEPANGAHLALPKTGPITMEVEIAVRFAREVRPASEAFDASMIDGAFVAFEVVRSRFVDRKTVGQLSFIGDDAGFHAFVLGDQIADSLAGALAAPPAVLLHDGTVMAVAMVGEERTDVASSIAQFWVHAAERQMVLPAGGLLTTGSQTPPTDTLKAGVYEGLIGDRSVKVVYA